MTGQTAAGTYRLAYIGPAAGLSMLVQMLEAEGATVRWHRPHEERGASEMAQGVAESLVAAGSLAAIRAAVAHFHRRVNGRANVKIEGEPDDGGFFDD